VIDTTMGLNTKTDSVTQGIPKKRADNTGSANRFVPLEWKRSTLEVGSAEFPHIYGAFGTGLEDSFTHMQAIQGKIGKWLQGNARSGSKRAREVR
jgi:hypothetical protein